MLPLICSTLPASNTLEAIELNKRTLTQQKCPLNMRIGILLLRVAEETANAVIDLRYKAFDPLVKNFGCQINAREIAEICRGSHDALCDEAQRIKQYVEQKAQIINELSVKPPQIGQTKSLADYLIKQAGITLEISAKMARLVRMRMLCIVNTNIEKEGREIPKTCIELLASKITPALQPKIIVKLIVGGIQAEESRLAASYVQTKAVQMPDTLQRSLTLMRSSCVITNPKTDTAIVSLPLMHNTEAALASFNGIICVKNKLQLCEKAIEGALEKKVFIKMPEAQAIKPIAIADEEPIIVIEGYIDNETNLLARIAEFGLLNIVKANCAILPQFASGASKEPLEDEEAQSDVVRYASLDFDAARNILEIDHIYCASFKEEK